MEGRGGGRVEPVMIAGQVLEEIAFLLLMDTVDCEIDKRAVRVVKMGTKVLYCTVQLKMEILRVCSLIIKIHGLCTVGRLHYKQGITREI